MAYRFLVALCFALATVMLQGAAAEQAQTTKKTAFREKTPSSGSQTQASAVAWSGDKVVLTAAQSRGGVLVDLSDGTQGVSLDKSCERPWPEVTCIQWDLASPLPAGWWHGTVDFSVREGEDKGYTNAQLGVVLRSPQKPLANLMNNFEKGAKDPQCFQFWTYISAPAGGVHIQDVYSHLWKYKRTWPILRVTLERAEPANLTSNDSVTLELPVQADGSVPLPATLPAGLWCLTAAMKKEGAAVCQCADGHSVSGAFRFDKWGRPLPLRFHLELPLKKVSIQTANSFSSLVLENCIIRPAESIAVEDELITTIDPAKSQAAKLEMFGVNLSGEAPSLPIFPGGRRTAVLTTWDDGALPDLRLAEIFHRLGYRPTFFLNQNNPAMKFLDKLEQLQVEIGSHCYHHPSLHLLPPQQATEECVQMRKLLEKELKHPVISFSYPNGYTPSYDAKGDYVLRAMRAAGYWSGRTTDVASETFDSIAEPLALKTNGFFGDRKGLERAWEETRVKEGGIFHFWGHGWQIGKTDEQWQDFEGFVAKFAGQADVWYASQGELFLWLWTRQNVRLTVSAKAPAQVAVTLSRPWLHPWLSARCPLSLRVPDGVERVRWQGEDIPVKNGFVELSWGVND